MKKIIVSVLFMLGLAFAAVSTADVAPGPKKNPESKPTSDSKPTTDSKPAAKPGATAC